MNDDNSISSSSSRARSPRLRSSPIIFQSPAISTSQIEEELKISSPEIYEKHIGCNKRNQSETQKDAFRAWIDHYCPGLIENDLVEELRDGIKLIGLLAHLSDDERLRAYYRKITSRRSHRGSLDSPQSLTYYPTTRAKRLSYVSTALEFMKKSRINLVNVNPMDIVEGRPTVILGLIWTLILHYQGEQSLKNSFTWSECSSITASCEDFTSDDPALPEFLITDPRGHHVSVSTNSLPRNLEHRPHGWPYESQRYDGKNTYKLFHDDNQSINYDALSVDIDLKSYDTVDLKSLDAHYPPEPVVDDKEESNHFSDIESYAPISEAGELIEEENVNLASTSNANVVPTTVENVNKGRWTFLRSIWNKVRRAFITSSSINVMLLIVVAGLCMLPLVQKDKCCELTPAYLDSTVFSGQNKPV